MTPIRPHAFAVVIALLSVMGSAHTPPAVRYDDNKVLTIRHEDGWYAYVGIPLSAGLGRHHLDVNGEREPFSVADKAYREQRLTITNTRKVDPNEDDLKRIRAERGRKVAAKSHWTETLLPPRPARRSWRQPPAKSSSSATSSSRATWCTSTTARA